MRANIVLLHGWGLDRHIWQPLQTLLKDQHVVTIDLPGYGDQTGNHTEWKLDTLAKDIIARSPQQAIYVGWSLGGLLALCIALHQPQYIKALMTIATTPCFVQKPGWECAMDRLSFDTFKQSCQSDSVNCLNEFKHLIALNGDKKTARKIHRHHCHVDTATLLFGLELLATSDLRFALQSLACPTTHLFAKGDALVPAAVAESMRSLSPNANTLLIDNASHALPISHADVIAQQLDALIHATH